MTKNGIEVQSKQLADAQRAYNYALAKQEYISAKQKFEDIATPIEREANKEKFKKDLKEIELVLESTQKTINIMNKQLTDGIKEKEIPRGVG